jgi:dTDP-4-dehydrorhamnose 3,5-epimerase-like enzyme
MTSVIKENGGVGVVDQLRAIELTEHGDERGSSYEISDGWIASGFVARDMHVTTTMPGCLRGNHYHVARREILIVTFTDRWSAYWDSGPDTDVRTAEFSGSGCVVLYVPRMVSHAIRNDGAARLHITAITDGPYDPEKPDAFTRKVVTA